MDVETLCKLRDCQIAFDRGDRHLSFECRRVISTRAFQDDLLLSQGFLAPQQMKSSHKTLFDYPRPPLSRSLTMAASDVPAAKLGATDPKTWGVPEWLSDIIPHVVYGLVTASVCDAIAGEMP